MTRADKVSVLKEPICGESSGDGGFNPRRRITGPVVTEAEGASAPHGRAQRGVACERQPEG